MNAAQDLAQAAAVPAYRHQPPSLYVVPAFYDWLLAASDDLAQAAVRTQGADAAQTQQVAQLLTLEARLLDQGSMDKTAYERWLALYGEECAYWVPAGAPAPDPRQYVTLEFHDRRRLLDRVSRLGTGLAFSQFPTSRTARHWGGLEVWPSPDRGNE